MNGPAPPAVTWTGVVLVIVLLVAGVVLFALGDVEPGNTLVSVGAGIVVGGGGVHLSSRNGSST